MNLRSLCFPAALLLACTVLHGEATTVQFDGASYQLASVTIAPDGAVTNEYFKEGESNENWTTRLTVRHLPSAPTISAAINPWLQSVRTMLTRKWEASRTPNARGDTDVIVEAWIMSSDPTKVEATLHRFVSENGTDGVKCYRFSEKLPAGDEEASLLFHRKSFTRSEALGQLSVAVKREK